MRRNSEEQGPVGGREEVGDAHSSRRHPPHVTPNAEAAPVQEDRPEAERQIPVLPANASGVDKLTPAEQHVEIRPESMYDGRSSQDKDRPPSQDDTQ